MIVLRINSQVGGTSTIEAIALMSFSHPGDHRLLIVVPTPDGTRRLQLGPDWTFAASDQCVAALEEFGAVEVLA